MNITMQLIWDRLLERDGVQKFGFMRSVPLLRPELLTESMRSEGGHIYVAEASGIPDDAVFDRNSLVVCAGEKENGAYTHGRFPAFVVPGTLAEVFNLVSSIYDWYDGWDRRLHQILNEDASPSALLQVSLPVIGNTLYLNDNKMNFIGKILDSDSNRALIDAESGQTDSVRGVLLLPYAESIQERIRQHGYDINPRQFFENGLPMYGVDLFFGKKRIGSLSMAANVRPFREGDPELLLHLARCLEAALSKRNSILETQTTTIREILLKFLGDVKIPEESIKSILFSSGEVPDRFRCIFIKSMGGTIQMQPDYLCRLLESTFHGCVSVEYLDGICVLFDTSSVTLTEKEFFRQLQVLLSSLRLNEGVSRAFQKIEDFKEAWRQAAAALDAHKSPQPGEICHFEKSILQYMLRNACGDFPASTLCPPGLLRLREYCEKSEVDYIRALRVWLECGCNDSEAARRLYLHRSTFVKRLDRIREFLDLDLTDPDDLLWLQMSMRLFPEI